MATGNLWDYTGYTVQASDPPIILASGEDIEFYLALAVDTLPNQSTGPSVTITVHGESGRDIATVLYGLAIGRWFRGRWVQLSGTGAIIELKIARSETFVASQTRFVA